MATFSLRSPNGSELQDLGPILELAVRDSRDRDSCSWDLVFPFSPSDRFFVVADEKTAWRWGPYSYQQMIRQAFVLRLTAEPRFFVPIAE